MDPMGYDNSIQYSSCVNDQLRFASLGCRVLPGLTSRAAKRAAALDSAKFEAIDSANILK